ncbi:TnsD family Tn7-like transposition protein [Paenibacillus swuensis]|nr:TnsD family Tn7-like transposition protein [Paenibacillus swuensis]
MKSPNINNKPRVDWIKRDKQVAHCINEAILEIRSAPGKPRRLTICRIGRHIGQLALLERHLDKLPICRALLHRNLETVVQHQKNKIDWAFDSLILSGNVLSEWRILREAAMRKYASTDVVSYLQQKLKLNIEQASIAS